MENVLQNPSVQRVSAKLKELGVKGEVHVLSDSARTAQEAADALGILVGQVASSIVFKLDDESPLLVIKVVAIVLILNWSLKNWE